jgi:hypothetical protein
MVMKVTIVTKVYITMVTKGMMVAKDTIVINVNMRIFATKATMVVKVTKVIM